MQIHLNLNSIRYFFIPLCMTLSFSVNAFAKVKKKSNIEDPIHYGMAGCGFGTLVFQDDTVGSQLGVTSLNYSSAPIAGTGLALSSTLAAGKGGGLGVAIIGTYVYYASIVAQIAFLPSWAMSSGTSNCIPPQSADELAHMERQVYLEANLTAISKEASRGEGEHLRTLSGLYGCNDGMSKIIFAKKTQEKYATLFDSDDSERIVDSLSNLVKNDDILDKQCNYF